MTLKIVIMYQVLNDNVVPIRGGLGGSADLLKILETCLKFSVGLENPNKATVL